MTEPLAPCPVCGRAPSATGMRATTTRQFDIARCDGCGLAFASPRTTEAELDALYTDEYFAGGGEHTGYADYRGDSWAEANAATMWTSLREWARVAIPEQSVLDIGCATGAFLATARDAGWRVCGVEKSAGARATAAHAFGLEVAESTESIGATFGLVTMWHVLEHVVDPVAALTEARRLLANGGVVFVELPNWASLGRRKNGVNWSQLRPPEHINFFDRRSLAAALERAGLRAVQVATLQPDVANRGAELSRRGHRVRGAAASVLASAAGRAGFGGYLRCAAVAD